MASGAATVSSLPFTLQRSRVFGDLISKSVLTHILVKDRLCTNHDVICLPPHFLSRSSFTFSCVVSLFPHHCVWMRMCAKPFLTPWWQTQAFDVNSGGSRATGLECGDPESSSGIRVSTRHVHFTLKKQHRMSTLTLVRGPNAPLALIYMFLASLSLESVWVCRGWRVVEVIKVGNFSWGMKDRSVYTKAFYMMWNFFQWLSFVGYLNNI